jgi:hypothetical protein
VLRLTYLPPVGLGCPAGASILLTGPDLGPKARGFENRPANVFPFQAVARSQHGAALLQLAALFDGELGAGKQ